MKTSPAVFCIKEKQSFANLVWCNIPLDGVSKYQVTVNIKANFEC